MGAPCSLEDVVGVEVNTGHIRRGVVQIKVAGVNSHDERAGGTQNISQGQRAERNIRARPVKRENHLRREQRDMQNKNVDAVLLTPIETYGHECLGDAGQHGRSQRVDQDLVFGDGKH